MKATKCLLVGVGIFAGLFSIVFAAGMMLPAEHTITRTVRLRQSPDAVFSALADATEMPKWSHNLASVEALPAVEGREATRQTFKSGLEMTVLTTESVRPTRLTRSTSEVNRRFSASWSYDITPAKGGCQVVLTEKGQISCPGTRLFTYLFGLPKYADEHLQDLAMKFGGTMVATR
ncbi:MAG: hypothetical protein JWR26_4202 [Pedosphaera sp.]|nr:hypothetical protein [Pedosphaera sp.]